MQALESALVSPIVRVTCVELSPGNRLPIRLDLALNARDVLRFRIYIWTVSGGGNRRAEDELRIQAKLPGSASVEITGRTTLLLGYYDASLARERHWPWSELAPDAQIFVAWDPVEHTIVGRSSSCQIKLESIERAYTFGTAMAIRRCASGNYENVLCFRPELLASYFEAARHGHRSASPRYLESSKFG